MRTETSTWPLVGGRICIDFVNTGLGAERLESYHDLVDWARAAEALDAGEAAFVLERWGRDGDPEALDAMQVAQALRGELHLMISGFASGVRTVPASAVDAINRSLKSRPGYLQLEGAGEDWAARWKVPLRRADDVLWRIARSAASLLAEDDWSLVRRCQRASCGLFFYDQTKNHRKRWCRPDVCGAAERAMAYYRRKRSGD